MYRRGRDRAEDIQRMKHALDLFVVEGIHTSIPLHKRILQYFEDGGFDTNFIKRWIAREC
jgi:acetyl-CoA carboxylase, biotin carboxylase subunit